MLRICPFSLNKIHRLLVVPASNAMIYFAIAFSPCFWKIVVDISIANFTEFENTDWL